MMRGINHQNIFEDEEDNWQFINTLDRMRMRTDDNGSTEDTEGTDHRNLNGWFGVACRQEIFGGNLF